MSHLHAAGLQPWHVLRMAQPKPKADEQRADNSSQQQEQKEQQQQQEPPGGQEDGPLEGPNGLLAEWRVESSSWWSKVFRLVVGGCCAALLYCPAIAEAGCCARPACHPELAVCHRWQTRACMLMAGWLMLRAECLLCHIL